MKTRICLLGIPFMFLFSSLANAGEMTLHCRKGPGPEACGQKVVTALEKLGCQVDSGSVTCELNPKSETAACQVVSSNCHKTWVGNFGGEDCRSSEKVKIPLREGVHNGYWFGPFGSYSRQICKAN